eukprot:767429-Hanusia_phi.AAC.5
MAAVIFPDGSVAVAISERALEAGKEGKNDKQRRDATEQAPPITYSLQPVDAIRCEPISVEPINCESMQVPGIHVDSIISADVRSDAIESIRND